VSEFTSFICIHFAGPAGSQAPAGQNSDVGATGATGVAGGQF